MINKFKNERGLTLVELLATLVIGAMVASLIFGIHVMIQNQYRTQKAEIAYLLDVTTVAKAITKDIRLSEEAKIVSDKSMELTIPGLASPRTYEWVGGAGGHIERDGGKYISDIAEFKLEEELEFELDAAGNQILDASGDPIVTSQKIKLLIASTSDRNKKIETEIMMR